jgi:hypothetical protein
LKTCSVVFVDIADLLHDYSHSKKDIVEALEMYEDEMELFCTLGGPSKSSYVGRIWSAHHLEVCEPFAVLILPLFRAVQTEIVCLLLYTS